MHQRFCFACRGITPTKTTSQIETDREEKDQRSEAHTALSLNEDV